MKAKRIRRMSDSVGLPSLHPVPSSCTFVSFWRWDLTEPSVLSTPAPVPNIPPPPDAAIAFEQTVVFIAPAGKRRLMPVTVSLGDFSGGGVG